MTSTEKRKLSDKRKRHMTVTYPKDVTKQMIIEILEEQGKDLDGLPNPDQIMEDVNSDVKLIINCEDEKVSFQGVDERVFPLEKMILNNFNTKADVDDYEIESSPVDEYTQSSNIVVKKKNKSFRTILQRLNPKPSELYIRNIDHSNVLKSVAWSGGTYFLNELLDEGLFDISRAGMAHIGHGVIFTSLFHKDIIRLVNDSGLKTFLSSMKINAQEEGPRHLLIGSILMNIQDLFNSGVSSDTLLAIGCVAVSLLSNRVKKYQNKSTIPMVKQTKR